MLERSSRPTVKVLEIDAHHAVGIYDNFMVVTWRGETTVAAVERAEKQLVRLMRAYPDGIALMQVAEQGAPPPDGASRNAVAKMLHSGSGQIQSSSLVCPGTGFAMAAGRAFVTGLSMMMRVGFPHQVFATLEDAAAWHAQKWPPGNTRQLSPSDLVAIASGLTVALDKHANN